MRAAAIPMADPQLELHRLPDPGFLIQGFLIQRRRRILLDSLSPGHLGRCFFGRGWMTPLKKGLPALALPMPMFGEPRVVVKFGGAPMTR